MTICSQTSDCILSTIGCFVYDFQTLLTGIIAIGVAVIAGIPVWRQLKDSNLQARISHRETLATLLRDALDRFGRVEKSIAETLSLASELTSDPIGEPIEIAAEDAYHLESALNGVLDWYLVTLKDTEHGDIETRNEDLKAALTRATATLHEAHWADHNVQQDEDHDLTDEAWAELEMLCAEAKVDAAERISDVRRAYRALQEAQQLWVRSLRTHIAKLDLQIASSQ